MKIVVKKNNERDIRLSCPNWIVINRITASFICEKLRDYGIYIKRRQLLKFYKLCKQYKKKNHGWKLIEVESSSKEKVEITM